MSRPQSMADYYLGVGTRHPRCENWARCPTCFERHERARKAAATRKAKAREVNSLEAQCYRAEQDMKRTHDQIIERELRG